MASGQDLAAGGRWGSVEWATDARGRMPAREFYQALSDGDKAKVNVLFARLAETGAITNREHFKKIQDGLFEFKRFQVRLLGDYRPGRRFLVAHGVIKKKDKLSAEDIRTAVRILRESDTREGRKA